MTALDRKTIQVGDTIHAAYAGSNYEGPYHHVWGGEVVATGGGSVVYRTADGRVDTLQSWSAVGVYSTEAEALEAAAEALERIAAQFTTAAAECRAKAVAEVAA